MSDDIDRAGDPDEADRKFCLAAWKKTHAQNGSWLEQQWAELVDWHLESVPDEKFDSPFMAVVQAAADPALIRAMSDDDLEFWGFLARLAASEIAYRATEKLKDTGTFTEDGWVRDKGGVP